MAPGDHAPDGDPVDSDAGVTLRLLTAARAGDAEAMDRLFARYVPGLRQWASGRLPRWARDISDTHDLVQETVLRVFRRLDGFEYRGEGALKAYLRHALMNRIRNEIRRSRSQRAEEALDSGIEDPGVSPLEWAVGAEVLDRYEAALTRLTSVEREHIIARVELGMTYEEMMHALDRPSIDAARMTVTRALVRLSEEMGRG